MLIPILERVSKSPKGDLLITVGHPTDFEDSDEFFTYHYTLMMVII